MIPALIIAAILVFMGIHGYWTCKKAWYPAAPVIQSGKKIVACIGDSITFSTDVQTRKEESTWEDHCEELTGGKYQFANYGLSGRTLLDEGDVPYRKSEFYGLTKQIPADLYLIMLGTNDSKPQNWNAEQYRAQLKKFAKEYQQLPHEHTVCLMTPPSCFPGKNGKVAFKINDAIIRDETRPIVQAVAEELQIPCIDLHSHTAGHSEWFKDGVHPNPEGRKAFASFIVKELTRLKLISF